MLASATSSEDPDEALDMSGLDPELVDIFVEEGGDLGQPRMQDLERLGLVEDGDRIRAARSEA